MTPLQRVAMGLVIVLLDPLFAGFDGLPDVLGWLLVLWGLHTLADPLPDHRVLDLLAAVSTVVSVPLFFPAFDDLLALPAQWAVSLPQAVFTVMLCRALAERVAPVQRIDVHPRRFRALFWVFVVLAVVPAVVYGGPVVSLVPVVGLSVVAAYAVLIWSLFAISKRPVFTA